jgi:uncharacterized protein (TIGR02996 family)
MNTRDAFEESLAANPDDVATHMAYADWLSEQAGDVLRTRGEFIRVQLALEDEHLAREQRQALEQQEQQLLRQHGIAWLGEDLLEELLPATGGWFRPKPNLIKRFHQALDQGAFRFVRGWLDHLETEIYEEDKDLLGQHPSLRLLRCLRFRFVRFEGLPASLLDKPPVFQHLRVLELGTDTSTNCGSGEGIAKLLPHLPHLEELSLMVHELDTSTLFALPALGQLRKLVIYHEYNYPLDILANNPAVTRLEHLSFWPHAVDPGDDEAYIRLEDVRALVRSPHLKSLAVLEIALSDMGDAGCEEIVRSGILRRLRVLKLGPGQISDAGARLLAGCPDLRHLEQLNLDRNCLTAEGIRTLEATGVPLSAQNQWTWSNNDNVNFDYLYEGDWE